MYAAIFTQGQKMELQNSHTVSNRNVLTVVTLFLVHRYESDKVEVVLYK